MTKQVMTQWPGSGLTSEVLPAIHFTVTMNAKEVKAELTHVENNYVMHVYHLSFSDGHSGEFFFDEEREVWIEVGSATTRYASAVGRDLEAISRFVFRKPWMRLWPAFELEGFNIWVVEEMEGYVVLYDGKAQFFFNRKKDWAVEMFRATEIDENVMLFVKYSLEGEGKLT